MIRRSAGTKFAGGSGRSFLLTAGALACLIYGVGCHEATGPQTVDSRELSVRIPAMKRAAEQNDGSAVASLVRQLDDDDPAVRLYAIQALQRLTGQDLDYRYYDEKETRKPALERWNKWLSEQKN